MRFYVNKVGLGLALLAATTACSGLSGSIGLEGGVDAGPVRGTGTVIMEVGKKPGPITHTVIPPIDYIGRCARLDIRMGDGTHIPGTPVLITGAPVTQTIPAGAVSTIESFFTWGSSGSRHVPAVNELRVEFATDETPFTSQACKVSMTVDGGARQP